MMDDLKGALRCGGDFSWIPQLDTTTEEISDCLDDLDFDWDNDALVFTTYTSETGLSTIPSSSTMLQAAQHKLDLTHLKEVDAGLRDTDDPMCTNELVELYCGDLEQGRTDFLENLRELVPQGLKCTKTTTTTTTTTAATTTDKSHSPSPEQVSLPEALIVCSSPEPTSGGKSEKSGVSGVLDSAPVDLIAEVVADTAVSNLATSEQDVAADQDEATTAATEEAKRRRAIRREMLLHKKIQGRKGLVNEPTTVMNDALLAEQVTQIAQMLVDDPAVTFAADKNAPAKEPEVSSPEIAPRNVAPEEIDPNSSTCSKSTKTSKASRSEESASPAASVTPTNATPDVMSSSSSVPEHLAELPSGTDPESRRQRRLIRNRLSAALHRQRKRETIDSQKKIIEEKDDMIAQLKSQLSEVQTRYKSLESAMSILVKYFGRDEIHRVLNMARSPKAEKDFVQVTSTPPHLANISSDSDNSVSSEDHETVTPSTSPMASPMHGIQSEGEEEEDTEYIAAAIQSRARPNKRKRSGVFPAMATMAMCAVLGCTLLPPSAFQQLFGPNDTTDMPVVTLPSAGMDSRRLLEESDLDEEIYSIDKWADFDFQHLMDQRMKTQSDRQQPQRQGKQNWVISPIETRPSMWVLDDVSNTPWTVERSIQLFDFRAVLSTSSRNAGSSVALTVPFVLSQPLRRDIPDTAIRNLSNAKSVRSIIQTTPVRHLRGSSSADAAFEQPDNRSQQKKWDNTWLRMDEDVERILEDAFSSKSELEAVPFSGQVADTIGSSFLFCPSAYGSLSPGFLELAGLAPSSGDVEHSEEHVVSNRWDWYANRANEARNIAELIQSSLDLDDDEGMEEAIESLLDFDGSNGVQDSTNGPTGSEESTALVPSFLEEYKKLLVEQSTSFSFPNGGVREGSPVVKAVLGGDDPYLSILLPASAISGDSTTSDEKNQPWIELGCQVLSARVVDGVRFVGDQSEAHSHQQHGESS